MTFPPSVLRVRVVDPSKSRRLWLPLLLIWPPLVLLWVGLLPLTVIVASLLARVGKGKAFLLLGPRAFRLFCALRGLRIDLQHADKSVLVCFW